MCTTIPQALNTDSESQQVLWQVPVIFYFSVSAVVKNSQITAPRKVISHKFYAHIIPNI